MPFGNFYEMSFSNFYELRYLNFNRLRFLILFQLRFCNEYKFIKKGYDFIFCISYLYLLLSSKPFLYT